MASTASFANPVPGKPAWQGNLHMPSLLIALFGAIGSLMLPLNLWLPHEGVYMGTRLYDLYFAALMEGRFDLPLRELRLEGHYAPDGTGYLYHGLGPLITRLPFAPFVDFPTSWVTPFSIWFWSMIGNICCHRAFELSLGAAPIENEKTRATARTLVALIIWMSGPAWLLISNTAIFNEPVSMAYAMGSGIVLLLARCAFAGKDIAKALVPMAILAGLTVHARPHLAAGYYAGISIITAFVFLRGALPERVRATGAMAILGLFGAILLASNAMRFHNPGVMHGSFESADVQYGWVYLGGESADSERAQGFTRYGQFNARRILPNAMMYSITPPPFGVLKQPRQDLEDFYRTLSPAVQFSRVEEPEVGVFLLWPVMILLMILGLRQRALWRMPNAAGMLAAGTGSALLLSYGTVTMRYHVDLWPLVLLPALFGVAPLARWFDAAGGGLRAARVALMAAVLLGVSMTLLAAGGQRMNFIEEEGFWTREFCLGLLTDKPLSDERKQEVCAVTHEPGMLR